MISRETDYNALHCYEMQWLTKGGANMIITGKKVGMFAGTLAILCSIFTLASNLLYKGTFSYVAIGLGLFSGVMLFVLCSNRTKKL